ncbi:prohibitin family protein [Candidatus Uhrbacteria bacterium]|nr:prohibitin family protein [Candidatus Uhrbacteria bacterium]
MSPENSLSQAEPARRNTVLKTVGYIVLVLVSMYVVNWGFALVSSPSDLGVAAGCGVLIGVLMVWWQVLKLYPLGGGVKDYIVGLWNKSTTKGGDHQAMILVLIASAFLFSAGCTRVNPGHVGIQVNLYGQDRGVDSYPRVTGMVWYNPFSTSIYEYPTFVQTAIWTAAKDEGSPTNEEISFNTKEGLVITADISLSYQLDPPKVPAFYVKFRSDALDTFTHGFLHNIARDAFNEIAPIYPVEEVYGPKKEEMLTAVRKRINDQVSTFGVEIQQFGFIGAMRLPVNVVDALNNKIKATQDAIRVENELRQASAEAKKMVAKAEGEAQANRTLAESITPNLIQWRQLELTQKSIERWNGQLPQYTGGPIPLLQLPQSNQAPAGNPK